jgi:uncharacterized protein YggU (UPF0235/DUF167 family)
MNPAAGAGFFRADGEGTLVFLRLTPRGGRDALEGVETLADGRAVLTARVRAVPEDGRANAAIEKLLAQKLGLPARAIRVVAGATSRLKTIRIDEAYQDVGEKLARLGVVPQD